MYKNSDFIYDAIFQLHQIADVVADVDSNRKEYDAIATINDIQFVVLSKPEIRTSNKGLVFGEIDDLKKKTKKPVVAIAKFIAADIAKELKEKGINYIDRAGNAYIKQGKLLLFFTGQKAEKPANFNQSRAFQESGIKLVFQLLTQPEDLQLSYRNLAGKTGIALGSVSIIMKELEYLKYLVKAKNKRYLKNKEQLLERWIIAFNDVLRPRIFKKRFRFPSKNNYSQWKSIGLDKVQGRNIWGGEPAAAILTNKLQPEIFSIYTNGIWQQLASSLKLIPDNDGDVEILSMFWKEDEETEKLNIVPPLIILAEIMSSGKERNIETAKLIIENELQHIKW